MVASTDVTLSFFGASAELPKTSHLSTKYVQCTFHSQQQTKQYTKQPIYEKYFQWEYSLFRKFKYSNFNHIVHCSLWIFDLTVILIFKFKVYVLRLEKSYVMAHWEIIIWCLNSILDSNINLISKMHQSGWFECFTLEITHIVCETTVLLSQLNTSITNRWVIFCLSFNVFCSSSYHHIMWWKNKVFLFWCTFSTAFYGENWISKRFWIYQVCLISTIKHEGLLDKLF